MNLSYLTWREYTRSGPVCFGALLVIAGAILALLPGYNPAYDFIPGYTVLIGAVVAIVGLLFIIMGFVFTKKKRDSVTGRIDTKKLSDTPPPPPPPD
jgi:drug/metabolite transporter (DMT)-like permease